MTKKNSDDILTTQFFEGVDIVDCVAVTVILIASSVSDLKEYKIRNPVILVGWLMGLAFRYHQGGLAAAGEGMISIIISILAGWPLFLIRGLGAGDIKLFSVIGGFYGLFFLARTFVLLIFFAGIISLIRLFHKKIFLNRIHYLFYYFLHRRKDSYYDAGRDGRDPVIPLVPVLAAAYYVMRVIVTGGII